MRKLLLALLLSISIAHAADNTVTLTPGSGVTMRTQDVGSGVQSPYNILGNTSGTSIYGTAGTSNTAVLSVQGIASGTALPVSVGGTVAVTQSGTWTVQPGNTANTTPWLVTGSGTAGAAASGVLTVQGVASMTPLLANPGTAANWGVGATGSAVPANGQYNGINVAGNLRGATGFSLGSTFSQTVAIVDGSGNQVTSFGGSGGTSSNYGSTFPTAGTAIGYTDGTNMVAARVGAVANVAAATNFVNSLGIAQYNATPLTVTDTRYQSLQSDINGFLKVNVTNATALGAAADAGSNPVTISTSQAITGQNVASPTRFLNPCQFNTTPTTITTGNVSPFQCDSGGKLLVNTGTVTVTATNLSTNVAQINGVPPLMGNGVTGTGSPRVTLASDGTAISTPGYMSVKIDQTTVGTTNAIRSIAGATGGGTVSSAIAPATPAGVNLKASAGTVLKVFATTIQSTPVYVKLYNSASAPTCGSGTPVARFMVPAAATAANGAGTNIDLGDIGVAFGTGIGYCVTGALADNDTTAITTNNTLVNIVWN